MFTTIALYASFDVFSLPVVWALISLGLIILVGSGMNAVDVQDIDGEDTSGRIVASKEEDKDILYELLHAHPKNPRDKGVFESTNPDYVALKMMFLAAKGWLPGNRVIVRPHPTIKGSYEILKGHRRSQVANKELGINLIPCTVLHGISDTEAVSIVMDQQTGLMLNDSERFGAFCTMVVQGFKRARIKAQLKLTDGDVTKYLRLMALPPIVQNDWKASVSKDAIQLKSLKINPKGDNLVALERAAKQDLANGHFGPVSEGESFKIAYESLVKQKSSPKVEKELEKYRPEDITRVAGSIHDRWLKFTFNRLAGLNKFNLDDLLLRLSFAHRYVVAIATKTPVPTDCDLADFGPDCKFGKPDAIKPDVVEPDVVKGKGAAHKHASRTKVTVKK